MHTLRPTAVKFYVSHLRIVVRDETAEYVKFGADPLEKADQYKSSPFPAYVIVEQFRLHTMILFQKSEFDIRAFLNRLSGWILHPLLVPSCFEHHHELEFCRARFPSPTGLLHPHTPTHTRHTNLTFPLPIRSSPIPTSPALSPMPHNLSWG